jgi:hypothetical protein
LHGFSPVLHFGGISEVSLIAASLFLTAEAAEGAEFFVVFLCALCVLGGGAWISRLPASVSPQPQKLHHYCCKYECRHCATAQKLRHGLGQRRAIHTSRHHLLQQKERAQTDAKEQPQATAEEDVPHLLAARVRSLASHYSDIAYSGSCQEAYQNKESLNNAYP